MNHLKVPRIIHHFWSNHDGSVTLPDDVARAINTTSTTFTNYQFMLWDRHSITELLGDLNTDYFGLFERVRIPAMQSDLARIAVLLKFGGVYLDVAIIPNSINTLPKFEALIGDSGLVVFESLEDKSVLMNRLIVAKPKLDILEEVLEVAFKNIKRSIKNRETSINVWQLTGSTLSRIVNQRRAEFKSVTRVDHSTTAMLFKRADCQYKSIYEGNWVQLQTGDRHCVYTST